MNKERLKKMTPNLLQGNKAQKVGKLFLMIRPKQHKKRGNDNIGKVICRNDCTSASTTVQIDRTIRQKILP